MGQCRSVLGTLELFFLDHKFRAVFLRNLILLFDLDLGTRL
jgi:hypothetical protein